MGWRVYYSKLRIKQVLGKKKWVLDQYDKMVKNSKSCKDTWYNRMDCLLAYMMFGAEPEDYFAGEYFEKRNLFYRNHCVTRTRLKAVMKCLNSREALKVFNSKEDFNVLYKDFIGRKWCCPQDVDEETFVNTFIACEGDVFVKPLEGFGGRGVFKAPGGEENLRKLYKELTSDGKKYIVEEYYQQKGFLHDVNPTSLNTLRFISMRDGDTVTPLYGFFRAGGAGSIVDNLHSDGVSYIVDMTNGELLKGVTWKENNIQVHPSTGIKVAGYKIPDWDKVVEFATKLHRNAPEGMHLVGWDICISDGELTVIEGNGSPMFLSDVRYSDNNWKKLRTLMNKM